MTNIEDERRKFEAWAVEFLPHVAGFYFDKRTDGSYTTTSAQMRWEAWLARAEADGWRPIESAPRDGTLILLARGERVTYGHWVRLEDAEDIDEPYWHSWDGGFLTDPEYDATHWMPLPAPPKEDGE